MNCSREFLRTNSSTVAADILHSFQTTSTTQTLRLVGGGRTLETTPRVEETLEGKKKLSGALMSFASQVCVITKCH